MIETANKHLHPRRALLIAAVLTMGYGALWAQPDGPGGPPPDGPPPGQMQQSSGPSVKRELKNLTQLLTLTTAQQAQIKTILTEEHQQMETLFSQSRRDEQSTKTSADSKADGDESTRKDAMETSRAAAKAIREEADVKISAVLTEDQKAKFESWEQKREAASKQQEDDDMPPPPDGQGGPPPEGGGGPPGI